MNIDKGSEETYRHLNSEYCKLIQMPEEAGDLLSGQNRENPHINPLDTRVTRRKFLEMLGIGVGALALGHPVVKELEAATKPNLPNPEKAAGLTISQILDKLTPEKPLEILVDMRDVNVIKDANGNVIGFDVLANQFGAAGRGTDFRIFNSSKAGGVFSEFNKKLGGFTKLSNAFYRHNGKSFVAVDSQLNDQGGFSPSEILIIDDATGRSESKPMAPAYISYRAAFPESSALVFGKYGELALVNMDTNKVEVIPVKLDHLEPGAVIGASLQRLSDNSILAGVVSQRGPYGVAEVKFNFSNLSLNGQPEWHYKDKRSDYYYGYVGNSGKVEEVYLYDRDNDRLFVADHTTKQKKDEYTIPGLYSIKVDEDEVIALVGVTGDVARKVWPRGVNPELNPEKVTTVKIQEGFYDGAASYSGVERIPEEGYINGELYDFILTAEKSVIAVKRQPNPDKSFDKYMLINGIPQSYEQPLATNTPTPPVTETASTPTPSPTPKNPTSTLTATPTVAQKIKQVFMPLINKANKVLGW